MGTRVPICRDTPHGGDDVMTGAGVDVTEMFGDAGRDMTDHAVGGNDTLTANMASIFSSCEVFGDCGGEMSGDAKGGDDNITVQGVSVASESLYGDAMTMSGDARGGNDVLQTAGSLSSTPNLDVVYGDAYSMSGNAVGGNDRLVGGTTGNDTLIGDAYQMGGNSRAGNDVLVSGHANDSMWGDAVVKGPNVIEGSNTFVFAPQNGNDVINDFHTNLDHIDLTADAAIGIDHFTDLDIQTAGSNSVIHLDANDSITVVGNVHLQASDFLLA